MDEFDVDFSDNSEEITPLELESDEGKSFICVKPWLGSILNCNSSNDMFQSIDDMESSKPDAKLILEHAYGYRSRGVRNNIRWADDVNIIYYTAAIGIIQNIFTGEQFFYLQHEEDIVSIDYHTERTIAATGSIGAHSSVMLNIWRIDINTKKTIHLQTIAEHLRYAAVTVAFNKCGNLLAASGADDNHTIIVFDWARGVPLVQMPSPGRNSIFEMKWLISSKHTHQFATAGWKHLYVWSMIQTKKEPQPILIRSTKAAGVDSYTSVSCVPDTIDKTMLVASTTSSLIIVFRLVSDDKNKKIAKKLVPLSQLYIPNNFNINPNVTDSLQLVSKLADELLSCGKAFSRDQSTISEMNSIHINIISNIDSLSKAIPKEANAQRVRYTLKARIQEYIEGLKCLVEDLWIDTLSAVVLSSAEDRKHMITKIAKAGNLKKTLTRPSAITGAKYTVDDLLDTSADSFVNIKKAWDCELAILVRENIASRNSLAKEKIRQEKRHLFDKKNDLTRNRTGPKDGPDLGISAIQSITCRDSGEMLISCLTGGKDGYLRMLSIDKINLSEGSNNPPEIPDCCSWCINMSNYFPGNDINSIKAIAVNPSQNCVVVGTALSSVYTVHLHTNVQTTPIAVHPEAESHYGSYRNIKKPTGYGELWGLSSHPFKRQVATTTEDCTIRVWDANFHTCVKRRNLTLTPWVCCYNSTGDLIAIGFKCGAFGVYNARSLLRLWPARELPLSSSCFRRSRINCLKFSPDGRYLAVAAFTNLDVYSFRYNTEAFSAERVQDLQYNGSCMGISSPVTHLDWSSDSSLLQCTSKSYELMFFDMTRTTNNQKYLQLTHSTSVITSCVSWATQTCPLGWNVQGIWGRFMDGTDINTCSRSSDGRFIATGNDAHLIELFKFPCIGSGLDARGRIKLRPHSKTYNGHSAHVTNVCWSADDSLLFTTGGNDCTVLQWAVLHSEVPDGVDVGRSPSKCSTHFNNNNNSSVRGGLHPCSTKKSKCGPNSCRKSKSPDAPPTSPPSNPLRRPHTHQYAKLNKGPIHRMTVTSQTRARFNRLRRQAFETTRMTESTKNSTASTEPTPTTKPVSQTDFTTSSAATI